MFQGLDYLITSGFCVTPTIDTILKWKSVILFNKANLCNLYCHDRVTQASFSGHTFPQITVMVIGSRQV